MLAPPGWKEVVKADPIPFAAPAGDDHGHAVIGKLGSGGKRQRSAVETMHAVRAEEPGQVRRATDARNDEDLMRPTPQLGARMEQPVEDAEVAAPRTPIGWNFRLEVFHLEYRGYRSH